MYKGPAAHTARGSKGGAHSWARTYRHAIGVKPTRRYAWPQNFKTGARNKGQTVTRQMHAMPDSGNGGATSKPSPKPPDGSSSGGGQGTKRAANLA